MASSTNPNPADRPTFAVGPQLVLSNSGLPKRGKQITFKTDQRQYRQGLRDISTTPNQFPVPPKSNPYSRKIRFADPKTQTGFTPKQFHPDEPPAKRAKVTRYERTHTEPTFSVRKPLKIKIPTDAWQLIFERCDPAFLLRARMVCRDFRDILSRQAVWRQARANFYGDEIPNPPKGMTEFRYAALLVGRGCQIEPCTRRDTRKVYWPFLLRMCENCFSRVTQTPSLTCVEARSYSDLYNSLEFEVRQTIPSQLPGLLPAGRLMSNRWCGPRLLDDEERNWRSRNMSDSLVVLADDYDSLRQDFHDKIENDPDYFLFWARLKWGETRDRMCKIAELEHIDLGETTRPYHLREEKIAMFRDKAYKLDPPMKFEVLQKFVAFHNAIDTQNAASLRSWDLLKAKIDVPELRAQAEQLVKWDNSVINFDWVLGERPESRLYRRVHEHRNPGKYDKPRTYTREQKVIIDIAHDELIDFLNTVHDEDVLLMWLNRVRRVYESLYQKPDGLNGDGTEGPYRLMLDDALLIVQDVLRPALWGCRDDMAQYKRVLTSLRCMGCTRTGTATTYEFPELMAHIRKIHGGLVSKDAQWYRFSIPTKPDWRGRDESVPYYLLPWFKTMPALPFHRLPVPGMIWNPDVETEYIQHGGARSSPTESTSAFDVLVTNQTRIPVDDFTSNFCRAVRTLADTRLPSVFVVKVALDYATRVRNSRRVAETSPTKLTIEQLENLETVCARMTSRIEFKFRCAKCAKDLAKSAGRRRPPKLRPLSAFASHWHQHGADEDICVTEQIVLPTEFELMKTMEDKDAKLETEKTAHLKRKKKVKSTASETIDPRTAALLATPSIRSCFDKLFTPRAIGKDQV